MFIVKGEKIRRLTLLRAGHLIRSISTFCFSITDPSFWDASKSIGTTESIRSTSRSIGAIEFICSISTVSIAITSPRCRDTLSITFKLLGRASCVGSEFLWRVRKKTVISQLLSKITMDMKLYLVPMIFDAFRGKQYTLLCNHWLTTTKSSTTLVYLFLYRETLIVWLFSDSSNSLNFRAFIAGRWGLPQGIQRLLR